MTSFSRAVSAPVIYAGLTAGALITLAPFALGLMTSFTTAEQLNTGEPLSLPEPPTAFSIRLPRAMIMLPVTTRRTCSGAMPETTSSAVALATPG